jgi:hypothetical protein
MSSEVNPASEPRFSPQLHIARHSPVNHVLDSLAPDLPQLALDLVLSNFTLERPQPPSVHHPENPIPNLEDIGVTIPEQFRSPHLPQPPERHSESRQEERRNEQTDFYKFHSLLWER